MPDVPFIGSSMPRVKKTTSFAYWKAKEKNYYYNLRLYRDIRFLYIQEHPLDELALADGKTVAATDIHHLIKFDDQPTDGLRRLALMCPDNLISLSASTHASVHGRTNAQSLSEVAVQTLLERKKRAFQVLQEQDPRIVWTDDYNPMPQEQSAHTTQPDKM